MKSHHFENLEIRKHGGRLGHGVCVASHGLQEFELKTPIPRPAISIPSNIAEGSPRSSDPDVCRDLGIEPCKAISATIQETLEISKRLEPLIDKPTPT